MSEQRCACKACSCTVDANALVQGGEAYCCEACATGHRHGEPCRMAGCKCSEAADAVPSNKAQPV
ncbi:metallothionein [Pseudomonas sp. NPDC089752]|uniref:metallothionein n=1 Tax=Pseudomonas sp. NPDC089752 TaxID=3364472 RepID=UPI0038218117